MAVADSPFEEGTHALTDGRTLRWALWGVPGGTPVVFCHGNPGSRLFRFDRTAIGSAGVCFISVDRPGCGGSTPRPGRRMIDWADDVRELADGLGLHRFGLVGMSMGGPHALACAAALNGRVTAVAVHGSPGPWSDPAFEGLAPRHIREMRDAFAVDAEAAEQQYRQAFAEQRRMMLEHPEQAFEAFLSRLTEPDRRLFAEPAARRLALEDSTEAVRSGSEGFFEERMAGYVLDWGFRLAEVAVPVTVFHGAGDVWVPVEVGRELAHRLPEADLRQIDSIGHFPPWSLHTELLAAVVGEPARQR